MLEFLQERSRSINALLDDVNTYFERLDPQGEEGPEVEAATKHYLELLAKTRSTIVTALPKIVHTLEDMLGAEKHHDGGSRRSGHGGGGKQSGKKGGAGSDRTPGSKSKGHGKSAAFADGEETYSLGDEEDEEDEDSNLSDLEDGEGNTLSAEDKEEAKKKGETIYTKLRGAIPQIQRS